MIVSRNQFFIMLLVLLTGPLIGYKLWWLATTRQTTGKVYFIGHTLELHGDISSHLVILFKAGKDSVTFNTGNKLNLTVGAAVPVRYKASDPTDAQIDRPGYFWGHTLLNLLYPLLVLAVLYFTPDSLDPLIPWKATIQLGKRPFIRVIPPTHREQA